MAQKRTASKRQRTRSAASIAATLLVGSTAVGACRQEQSDSVEPPTQTAQAVPAVVLPSPTLWETPLTDPDLEEGRLIWTGTCINCHSIGLGGAPFIGNKSLWQPRIDQGIETLVEHATRGFYGDVGEMPARGGNEALTDKQVRLAVRFMVNAIDR